MYTDLILLKLLSPPSIDSLQDSSIQQHAFSNSSGRSPHCVHWFLVGSYKWMLEIALPPSALYLPPTAKSVLPMAMGDDQKNGTLATNSSQPEQARDMREGT